MRQRTYMVDNMVSTSFFLSWEAVNVAGKTLRVTVPMNGRIFDMRGLKPALFSTFEDVKLYAPAGVKVLLTGIDEPPSAGSSALLERTASGYLDPARDVRYTLQFDITFAADVVDGTDVLMTVWGKPIATGIAAPSSWPTIETTAEPEITVKDTGNAPAAIGCDVLDVTNEAIPILTTITGSFDVTGLAQGDEVEVTVNHHDDADFSFCEYPVITDAPQGVVISVLARGVDNDSTNGQQFVLLVQNGTEGNPGYDYDGNFTVEWLRKGYL